MLKKLRVKLTLLCTLVTGAVLLFMAFLALTISESQMTRASTAAFESNIGMIVNKLQSDKAIGVTWLAQTETSNGLIVHIEDNHHPLSFQGAWSPLTGRTALIEKVQEKALTEYNLDIDVAPSSLLEQSKAIFDLRGEQGERYLAAAVLIPASNGFQSLTLLRDMRREDAETVQQRITFLCLSLLAIFALLWLSWWLAGRAIMPIAQNMKKQVEFVSAASHELRSPLAVIRASASAIAAAPEEAIHFCSNIERECGRMGRLIEDLLLLAGSDAKTWPVSMRKIDTDTLLVETAELFYPVAHKRQQQLLLELPEETLPAVTGDFQRLQQTLSILLDNAFCYSPQGGKVILRAYAADRSLVIEVADSGAGIPPEHATRIFDRFYRVDKARNDKSHFGLGLSIAQELMHLHHGKLTLKQSDSTGSRFALELPIN